MNGQPINLSLLTTLRRLCTDLEIVEEQLNPLVDEQRRIRAEIEFTTHQLGGKAEVDGFGTVEIIKPTLVVSYDRKALEQLIIRLVEFGDAETARLITACKKEYPRNGGLRISRLKSEDSDGAHQQLHPPV